MSLQPDISVLFNDKTKVNKLYHISDIHVNLQKRHNEFREVFEKLYLKLNEFKVKEKSALIVITGDVLNSKNIMTPELIVLVQELFGRLAQIYPVILIAGNHDAILTNNDRMDSLTPLVFSYSQPIKKLINNQSDKYPNFYYLRESGLYRYNNIIFSVASVFDSMVIPAKDINVGIDDLKIALHHGTLDGCTTELGHILRSNLSVKDFDGYDAVLLGDIHKYQYLDERKRIYYPGSLLQLNHGETLHNHGILEWNLNNFHTQLHEIPNDYGFCTITIRKNKVIKTPSYVPLKPRIRFRVDLSTDDQKFAEIRQYYRQNYQLQEEVVDNMAVWGERMTDDNLVEEEKNTPEPDDISTNLAIDILNPNIQKQLIVDHLKAKNMDNSIIDKLLILNGQINEEAASNEKQNTESNIIHINANQLKWKIKNLTFSNMFSYGENNVIDFSQFNQISGIFGDNAIGKSSILDIILFVLFDKCSRGDRTDVLNKKKNHFQCEITLTIGCNLYRIQRKGIKQTKTVKGEKKISVRIDVSFEQLQNDGNIINLSGQDRNDTNHKIRELLGTYEDFLMSTFLLQKGSDKFLKMAQVDQKIRLYDLFKLNWFEKLYTLAKSKLDYYNHKIKDLEKMGVNDLLAQNQTELLNVNGDIDPLIKEINDTDLLMQQINDQIDNLKAQIVVIQSMDLSLDDIDKQLNIYESQYVISLQKINDLNKSIKNQLPMIDKLSEVLDQSYKNEATIVEKEIKDIELQMAQLNVSIKNRQKQLINYNHDNYEIVKSSYQLELQNNEQIIEQKRFEQESLIKQLNEKQNENGIQLNDIDIDKQIKQITKGKDKLIEKCERYNTEINKLHKEIKTLPSLNVDTDQLCNLQLSYDDLQKIILINNEKYINMTNNDLLEYNKLIKTRTDKQKLLDHIKYQIQTIKSTSHKLLLVKHDPKCDYCMNNIFVVEAKQCINQLSQLENEHKNLTETLNELNKKIDEMDIINLMSILKTSLQTNKSELTMIQKQMNQIQKNIDNARDIELNNQRVELLIKDNNENLSKTKSDVDKYENALKVRNDLVYLQGLISKISNEIIIDQNINEKMQQKIFALEKSNELYILNDIDQETTNKSIIKLDDQRSKLNQLRKQIDLYDTHIKDKLLLDKLQSNEALLKIQIDELKNKQSIYMQNMEIVEKNKHNEQKLKNIYLEKGKTNIRQCILNKQREQLIIKKTILETKNNQYSGHVMELAQIHQDVIIYQEYCQCLGKNGLPHELLMKIIDRISEIANNILKQIADFTIQFIDDRKKLSICIHRDGIIQSTDMTSGFEEFVIELSLKIAFSMVSNVARPNFLAIDEGFGCLDSDHLSSLTSVLNFIKTKFDFILIITHINELKSQGDYHIHIKKLQNADRDSYVNNQRLFKQPNNTNIQTPKLKAPKLKLKAP